MPHRVDYLRPVVQRELARGLHALEGFDDFLRRRDSQRPHEARTIEELQNLIGIQPVEFDGFELLTAVEMEHDSQLFQLELVDLLLAFGRVGLLLVSSEELPDLGIGEVYDDKGYVAEDVGAEEARRAVGRRDRVQLHELLCL